jgi:MYXO-CTERM domain-containing protein
VARGFSRLPLRGPRADAALAALLACLAQAEIWTVGDPDGPRPLVAFTALVMTLSLGWRRRAPIAVATVVMAALTVLALASDTPDVTVFPIAAVVLAMYSVAAHCELRGALIGAAVVLVPAFVLAAVIDGEFGNFLFIAVMNASVWVAGRNGQQRSLKPLALEPIRELAVASRQAVGHSRRASSGRWHNLTIPVRRREKCRRSGPPSASW